MMQVVAAPGPHSWSVVPLGPDHLTSAQASSDPTELPGVRSRHCRAGAVVKQTLRGQRCGLRGQT